MRLTKRYTGVDHFKMHYKKLKNIVWTKRVGHLFERVTDIENIKRAIRRAAKRKTNRPSVQRILNDIDNYARKIQEMLLNETFVPGKYTIREIYDGIKKKKRIIAVPRFYPDQCVHHAFVQVFREIVEHGADKFSCGCVPGKGTDGARKMIKHWIKSDPVGTSKVLKLDVHHCKVPRHMAFSFHLQLVKRQFWKYL